MPVQRLQVYEIPMQVHIRKLRKKLRQIESLESLSRPLSEEEALKVESKHSTRTQLQELLKTSEKSIEDEIIQGQLESGILVDLVPDPPAVKPEPKNKNQEKKPEVDLSEEVLFTKKQDDKEPKKGILKADKKKKEKSESSGWKDKVFTLRQLEGHNDLISSAVVDGDLIISSSRDTTVKVWKASAGEEVASLRGHTAGVTCVVLVSEEGSVNLAQQLALYYKEVSPNRKHRIVISGGSDCNVKIWTLLTGSEIKSIYTYNGITCLGYVESQMRLITGTDGGKLELWDIITGRNLQSLNTYDDYLCCMKVQNDFIYTGSPDGIVRVWQLREEELSLLFASEDLLFEHVGGLLSRSVCDLEVVDDCIIYGDEGVNLKVINWKQGKVFKSRNHVCDFGATEAICRTVQELISSSYDIDTGLASLNVRHCGTRAYLGTLDGRVGRILSLSCTMTSSNTIRIVSAGKELVVWDELQSNDTLSLEQSNVVFVKWDPLYNSAAVNSEVESSASETDDDAASDEEGFYYEKTYIPKEITSNTYSLWNWCTIV